MASVFDLNLLKEHDEKYLEKLEEARRKMPVPKRMRYSKNDSAVIRASKTRQQNKYITKKLLRKYHSLANSLFNEEGFLKQSAQRVKGQWVPRKIRQVDAQPGLVRRNLRDTDIGKMFTFMYNPKLKDKLEYYDTMPVVIILNQTENGFMGLNFHMMAPQYRLLLLQELKKIETLQGLKKFFRITWRMVKHNNRFRWARPMIRQYLYKQCRSMLIQIPEQDWEIMQILPPPPMKGRKEMSVWAENRRKALR